MQIVDITALDQPLVVNGFPNPGHSARDLDVDSEHGILAMAVSDDFGSGYVRFFNLFDDELTPPLGYSLITFSEEGDDPLRLQGQPFDVQL